MKKTVFYYAIMAILAMGCQAEIEPDNSMGGEVSDVIFTAVTESSAFVKTSLNPSADNEKIYNIHWSAGDKVLVSDGNVSAEYTAAPDAENPTYASLTTTAPNAPAEGAEKYYAVFPSLEGAVAGKDGYTVVIPAEQTWEQGEFDMPMVGLGDSEQHISFMNAASILKIKPKNLCDSYDGVRVAKIEVSSETEMIAGNVDVTYAGTSVPAFGAVEGGSKTITLDCGENGAPFSETFYIALVPGAYETLTITITSNGGGSQTFTLNTPEGKKYERSKYASVGLKINNLAIYEPANCYIINGPGTYKFPVNVMGNGVVVDKCSVSSSVLDPQSIQGYKARAISQYGKNLNFVKANLARTMLNVNLSDGFISFEIPEGYLRGNVLIGVYSTEACTEGTCLWQWHIWINSDVADCEVGGHTILNMNLGSLQKSAEDDLSAYAGSNSGLYYQWGRKDPFHGLVEHSTQLTTLVSGLGYSVNVACANPTQNRANLAGGIAYPSTFYTGKETIVTQQDGGSSETTYNRRAWFQGTDDVTALLWGGEIISDVNSLSKLTVRKTMFDPCPPGYHVPDAKVLYDVISSLPMDGYRLVPDSDKNEQLHKRGEQKHYWAASAHSIGSMNAVAYSNTKVAAVVKSYAMPIRAQKQ